MKTNLYVIAHMCNLKNKMNKYNKTEGDLQMPRTN